MKKLYIIILLILLLPLSVKANKVNVEFAKCIDGDTARFVINGKEEKVRFLAIDTPETKHPKKKEQPFGKEASTYTCKKIKNAKKIELELEGANTKDKYGRYLAFVWVDDSLLQKELVEKGLAKVAYLYEQYTYTPILEKAQNRAKKNKLGIWKNEKKTSISYITIITMIVILLLCLINKRYRNKVKRNIKKKIKRNIIKKLKI